MTFDNPYLLVYIAIITMLSLRSYGVETTPLGRVRKRYKRGKRDRECLAYVHVQKKLLLYFLAFSQESFMADEDRYISSSDRIHVFWHEGMLRYEAGGGTDPGFLDVIEKHAENGDRLRNIVSILKRGPIAPFVSWHMGRPATVQELLSFHSKDYIEELLKANEAGEGKEICTGTFLNPGTWDSALLAAGTALEAVKYVTEGHGKIAYAIVRPPGHHAQPTQADGFCFLNNAGIAIHSALNSGCQRVAVLDIDVHHGNGTGEGFYGSDKVLTVSIHMYHGSWGPEHPHNGTIDELGVGQGFGYNLNIPLPHGSGNRGYAYAMNQLVIPAVDKFKPGLIVFVIGQDSSYRDPFGSQCLTTAGYREMGSMVRSLADKHCDGRVVIVQEGGYHVSYSAYCVHATLEGVLNVQNPLLSDPIDFLPEDESFTVKAVDAIKQFHVDTVPFLKEPS